MRPFFFVLPVAFLVACAPRATHVPPPLPVSTGWVDVPVGATAGAAVDSGRWWADFGDAELVSVVDRVLAANGDLAAAGFRLQRARLATSLAGRALLPEASASLDSGATRALDNSARTKSSGAVLGVAWEADLFGRLDAERDAQRWEAVATAEDLAATRLALIGTTATAWWQLAHANERIQLGEQSIVYARRALQLVRVQYDAGQVSRVELRDAEQSVAAQEAAQTQLVQARTEARNALAALLAQHGYDGPEPPRLPRGELPAVDAGLPARILSRRPDLAAAEHRLRASLAAVDATRASFYPALRLTGAVGTSSNELVEFFANPVASLGALLSLPFLNPERVRLSVGIARTDYEAAVATFRQGFYNALADVSDTLSARARYAEQAGLLGRSLAAAQDAETLYERQYRAGAIALRSWLDAQERRRNAQAAVADNRLNRLVNQVVLHQALGGDARDPAL